MTLASSLRLIHRSSRVSRKFAKRTHIFPEMLLRAGPRSLTRIITIIFVIHRGACAYDLRQRRDELPSAYFREKFKARLIFVRRPAINRSRNPSSRDCAGCTLWCSKNLIKFAEVKEKDVLDVYRSDAFCIENARDFQAPN